MSATVRKSERLRDLLSRPQATLICGVYDGLSARIAERAGFDGVWASGFCISASKRIPDVGLITMSEHLAATCEINKATNLPVVADVDDGFGDAINVTRMVREYEGAGIAAICMEDNRHPKRCSLYEGLERALVSSEEFTMKIRAAKEARTDPSFLVIARTEALVAGLGLPEARRRGRAYARAGADIILVHSKDPDPRPVLEFGRSWDGGLPLAAVPTKYPSVKVSDLYARGYRLVIFANQGLRASVAAVDRVFRRMVQTQSLASVEDQISPLSEIFSLVDMDEVRRLESHLMTPAARDPAPDGTKD